MVGKSAGNESPLGFNLAWTIVLVVGLGLIAIGGLLGDISNYDFHTLPEENQDKQQNLAVTGLVFANFGTLTSAAALLLAGIRAENAHAGMRGLLIVLGALFALGGFTMAFFFEGGFNGGF